MTRDAGNLFQYFTTRTVLAIFYRYALSAQLWVGEERNQARG